MSTNLPTFSRNLSSTFRSAFLESFCDRLPATQLDKRGRIGNDQEISDLELVLAHVPGTDEASAPIMRPLKAYLSAIWAMLGLDLGTILMMLK